MRAMTQSNLQAAFAGESQAHMKYLNFAKKAEEEGKANVARLFRAASFAEEVHASRHLQTLDGVGATRDNLSAALEGEGFEVDEMYPAYLAVADEQEEAFAQQSFSRAYQTEQQHREFYARAKKAADAGADAAIDALWVCSNCGCTLEGDAPDKCPICGHARRSFAKF
jgi:rubrerythrin